MSKQSLVTGPDYISISLDVSDANILLHILEFLETPPCPHVAMSFYIAELNGLSHPEILLIIEKLSARFLDVLNS